MSEYEIYSYEAFRKRICDDLRTVDNQEFFIPDQSKIQAYLTAVKTDRANLSKHVSDQQLFALMGITVSGKPTLAGLMTFSVYPQAVFPQLCITAVCLPGTEMGILGSDGERFIDSRRITGPIPDMLEEAVKFVRRNSRTKTIEDANGHRIDKPEYPMKVVFRRKFITPLLKSGELKMTNPDKPRSPTQKYFRPSNT